MTPGASPPNLDMILVATPHFRDRIYVRHASDWLSVFLLICTTAAVDVTALLWVYALPTQQSRVEHIL